MIPWTAGGFGDGKLVVGSDQRPGWECQDGGINPAGENGGYEVEKKKEKTHKEEEAYVEMTKREKLKRRSGNARRPARAGAQPGACPNSDGQCDYGLSDLIINQIALEQQDIVTDPLLNAWQDSGHYEVTDECRILFGPTLGGSVVRQPLRPTPARSPTRTSAGGNYYLNDAFNLAADRLAYPAYGCLHTSTSTRNSPRRTRSTRAKSSASTAWSPTSRSTRRSATPPTGPPTPNYATFTWNFGDGTPEVSGYAPGVAALRIAVAEPLRGERLPHLPVRR